VEEKTSPMTIEEATLILTAYQKQLWASVVQEDAPEELFHYTDTTGLCGILTGKKIWASDVLCLSDRSELRYGMDKIRDFLREKAGPIWTVFAPFLISGKDLGRGENISAYAACFCEKKDLLSQWRGYAGKNNGFAVGFHRNKLTPPSFQSTKLVYDPTRQAAILRSTLEHGLELHSKLGEVDKPIFEGQVLVAILKTLGILKNPAFEEEHEWRIWKMISYFLEKNNLEQVKYRAAGGNIIPYVEIPFEADALSRIVCGPGESREYNVPTIRRMVKQKYGLDVPVEMSAIPYA
jgi:hypothetical protein